MTEHASTPKDKGTGLNLHALLCLALAPALLTAVATSKLFGSHDEMRSPWKGGAFGMFSSIDYPQARIYRVSLINGDTATPVVLDGRFTESMWLWKNMPTDKNLQVAADLFASYTWAHPATIDSNSLTPENPDLLIQLRPMGVDKPPAEGFVEFSFERARVEIWRYGFDSKTATSEMVLINSIEGDRP